MKLKKLLGNNAHWSINKALYFELGFEATLLLQHLIDLEDSFFKGNEFFQQDERIGNDLNLSLHHVRKARNILVKKGILTCERKGMPAKYYYTINADIVIEILECNTKTKEVKNDDVSHQKSETQVIKTVNVSHQKGETLDIKNFNDLSLKPLTRNTKNLDTKNLDTKNRKEKELKNTKNLKAKSLKPEPHLFVFSNTESISTGDIKVDSILDEL